MPSGVAYVNGDCTGSGSATSSAREIIPSVI
jgi:hypothetical protein